MVIEPCLTGTLEMLFLAVAAMGYQQRMAQGGHQAQAPSDLVAVHLGQADIEQHDIRAEFLAQCKAPGPSQAVRTSCPSIRKRVALLSSASRLSSTTRIRILPIFGPARIAT
jgi:hypothetical protein